MVKEKRCDCGFLVTECEDSICRHVKPKSMNLYCRLDISEREARWLVELLTIIESGMEIYVGDNEEQSKAFAKSLMHKIKSNFPGY